VSLCEALFDNLKQKVITRKREAAAVKAAGNDGLENTEIARLKINGAAGREKQYRAASLKLRLQALKSSQQVQKLKNRQKHPLFCPF
jgi:hypothetical protein